MLRGLVLAESGRPDDAEPAFGQALALLAGAGGDPLLEADIRTNRSIAAITLGHARLAGADLTRAEVGYRELGHHGRLAMVRHNQALLADLTGDLPTALRLFDDAEALYRSAGRPAGLLPIERAQTLLGALLVPEARAAARRAEAEFTATGNRTDAVQAMLLAAQAALLADDPAAARAGRTARTSRIDAPTPAGVGGAGRFPGGAGRRARRVGHRADPKDGCDQRPRAGRRRLAPGRRRSPAHPGPAGPGRGQTGRGPTGARRGHPTPRP